jgi:hypothetical protein
MLRRLIHDGRRNDHQLITVSFCEKSVSANGVDPFPTPYATYDANPGSSEAWNPVNQKRIAVRTAIRMLAESAISVRSTFDG